jgi:hypothetical protein
MTLGASIFASEYFLNYLERRLCAIPCGEKRLDFPVTSMAAEVKKEGRLDEIVETLDREVELH